MDFKDAFVLWRGLGIDYEGGVLDHPARVAIHFTHRLGALVAALVLGFVAWQAHAHRPVARRAHGGHGAGGGARGAAAARAVMVLKTFPLPLATAHNAVAALLLLAMVRCCGSCWPPRSRGALTPGCTAALATERPLAGAYNRPLMSTASPASLPARRDLARLLRARQAEGRGADRVHRDRRHVPRRARHAAARQRCVFGTVGIGLAASSAAAINHVLDRRFDEKMARTMNRPLPTGHVTTRQALAYAAVIGVVVDAVLWLLVNPLTAVLTFALADRLRGALHGLAQARDAAEHRDRRRGRRGAAGARLDGGHGHRPTRTRCCCS